MFNKFRKWFGKGESDIELHLPSNEKANFILVVDGNIKVGILKCNDGEWTFEYTDEFKNQYSSKYNRIIGFPDLSKEYKSDHLWPFFRVRIPGLKQPAIQEILKREKIDKENEAALLKRFGHKTIANPYELRVG